MGDKATKWIRERRKPSAQEKRVMESRRKRKDIYDKIGRSKRFDEITKFKL